MGRKKKSEQSKMSEETRHGVLSVLFFALTVFFTLSRFGYAGPVGKTVYKSLDFLFGLGFILIPAVCLILAISFLKSIRPAFVTKRFVMSGFLFLSALGLISTLINDKSGGVVGEFISNPLLSLFDVYATTVFLSAIVVISTLVIFDTKLSFSFLNFSFPSFNLFKKKETNPEEDADVSVYQGNEDEDYSDEEADEEEAETNSTEKQSKEKSNDEDDGGIIGKMFGQNKKTFTHNFTPPPLSLLSRDSGKPGVGDIKANANIIKRTLANFGIQVEMDEVSIGPSVTRYAFKPAEGVKLSRIVALQNDLSLALAAHPLRIEAPIPGKSLVGIEMPNTTKTTVGLASLIGSKEWETSSNPLLLSLGRGITGSSHFANLAKAPHMLIAGATGSGKSVVIHTFITSLLYRNSPENLRFIMIDPKRVELTLYKKIPHLLTPVITDAKKAILALKWAAKEMDRRYDVLESETVRDIDSYHKNVVEPAYSKKEIPDEAELPEKMPYIVIIIDELADIMTAYPRELEAAIVRLAQMSRAVGIHLVLSTQRPSVEVITGLIKANVPTRVALQVASQIDSRTILDMAGAEKLLGAGDMLYMGQEMSKPIRLQSAYVSENEVKEVVKYLNKEYENELPDTIEFTGGSGETGQSSLFGADLEDGDEDDLYEDARMTVVESGKASASFLQRKLKVGYARAARLLDMLEERGIIGPGEGAKAREVYVDQNSTIPEDEG